MKVFATPLILLTRFYQRAISPLFPRRCKYYPTCSAYAIGAWKTHGLLKGTTLALWRILRCNPWSLGGVDEVPERGRWKPDPFPTYSELIKQYEETKP
ncbi:membrane protein insertion efficiency factor YidD [Actinomycetaceae bacterium TAE3-ERU4]|nr:membrane protein insertion efficiency factor YidD [Actinomycetaceae bacterium TAE3-ERU4]